MELSNELTSQKGSFPTQVPSPTQNNKTPKLNKDMTSHKSRSILDLKMEKKNKERPNNHNHRQQFPVNSVKECLTDELDRRPASLYASSYERVIF